MATYIGEITRTDDGLMADWQPELGGEIGIRLVQDITYSPMPAAMRNKLITAAYQDFAAAMWAKLYEVDL